MDQGGEKVRVSGFFNTTLLVSTNVVQFWTRNPLGSDMKSTNSIEETTVTNNHRRMSRYL